MPVGGEETLQTIERIKGKSPTFACFLNEKQPIDFTIYGMEAFRARLNKRSKSKEEETLFAGDIVTILDALNFFTPYYARDLHAKMSCVCLLATIGDEIRDFSEVQLVSQLITEKLVDSNILSEEWSAPNRRPILQNLVKGVIDTGVRRGSIIDAKLGPQTIDSTARTITTPSQLR